MHKSLSIEATEYASAAPQPNRLVRGYSLVSAFAFIILSITMLILSLFTPMSIIFRGNEVVFSLSIILTGAEIAFSLGMLHAAILLLRTILSKHRMSHGIGILPGDAAIANAFLYFGISMTAFHLGYTSPTIALAQFITALVGLAFGAGGLALSGVSQPARPLGHITFPIMLRDGVILVVGTILMAIAFGQLAGEALKAPQWNWFSFLGITTPGMFLLMGREGIKARLETRQGLARIPGLLITETLLVLGLAIMLYGSYANLTLGVNGYQVGPKGNETGLILWMVAALLLLVLRGAFKLAISRRGNHVGYRMISKFIYVMILVIFIYSERSFLSGHAPVFAVGGAAPAVAVILFAAFLVLVVGRAAGQKVSLSPARSR
ncbi:hypothetical protein KSF_005610 [Reticulibacter mediterranei]|uniref:Uncharacterized protein n=1 Tax=Reticulibacter mediterranei TaxID=2778369 RepID=A0A8J3IBE1_9CHLR|nr:hypothetical protein [Reticulibacter mediterranei]GHO90513.1 hypothetical protein KSF_005610 [Reticulibacter mediterranei]